VALQLDRALIRHRELLGIVSFSWEEEKGGSYAVQTDLCTQAGSRTVIWSVMLNLNGSGLSRLMSREE
jgi:hypothetical protein